MSETFLGIDVHSVRPTGMIRRCWRSCCGVPPYAIRVLRTLVRQRQHLVKMAVMNKNRIRHLLFLHGVTLMLC